jgi:hypothetical protein
VQNASVEHGDQLMHSSRALEVGEHGYVAISKPSYRLPFDGNEVLNLGEHRDSTIGYRGDDARLNQEAIGTNGGTRRASLRELRGLHELAAIIALTVKPNFAALLCSLLGHGCFPCFGVRFARPQESLGHTLTGNANTYLRQYLSIPRIPL